MNSEQIALLHLQVLLEEEGVSVGGRGGQEVGPGAGGQEDPGGQTLLQLQDTLRPPEQQGAGVHLLTAGQGPGDDLDIVVSRLDNLDQGHVGDQAGLAGSVAVVADREDGVVLIEGE